MVDEDTNELRNSSDKNSDSASSNSEDGESCISLSDNSPDSFKENES